MPNLFTSLLSESLKIILSAKENEGELKYFLNTFLNIPEEKLTKLEVYYNTILNTIEMTKEGIISDCIIKYNQKIAKIKTYHVEKNDFIIHILLYSLENEHTKLLEIHYTKNMNKNRDIIEHYHLQDKKFKDLLEIKIINTNRLNELDNSTSINRWIKFIGASCDEERLEVAKEDDKLMNLYKKLK